MRVKRIVNYLAKPETVVPVFEQVMTPANGAKLPTSETPTTPVFGWLITLPVKIRAGNIAFKKPKPKMNLTLSRLKLKNAPAFLGKLALRHLPLAAVCGPPLFVLPIKTLILFNLVMIVLPVVRRSGNLNMPVPNVPVTLFLVITLLVQFRVPLKPKLKRVIPVFVSVNLPVKQEYKMLLVFAIIIIPLAKLRMNGSATATPSSLHRHRHRRVPKPPPIVLLKLPRQAVFNVWLHKLQFGPLALF